MFSQLLNDIDFNSPDGRVIRASASGAVDLGFNPSRVEPMTLKLAFTAASLLDAAQHSVKNKPASLLVVPLGKARSRIPPSLCNRQMAGNSYSSSL